MKQALIILNTFLLSLFAFTQLACNGGGTTGTGDIVPPRVVKFVGEVLSDEAAQPLSEVTVEVEEQGGKAVTDEAGKFEIETPLDTTNALLKLSGKQTDGRTFSAEVLIADIPREQSVVMLVLKVDQVRGEVSIESISIEVYPTETTNLSQPGRSLTPEPVQQKRQSLKSVFKGSIKFKTSGEAVKNARITLPALNKTSVSNSKGLFEIKAKNFPEELAVELSFKDHLSYFSISGIPQGAPVSIKIALVLTEPSPQQSGSSSVNSPQDNDYKLEVAAVDIKSR